MNATKKKLSTGRGETLVETLIAIVVISLASVALASMIVTASKLNSSARESDRRLYAAISELETGAAGSSDGIVRVTLNDNQSRQISFPVSIQSGEDGLLTAYEYDGGGK